jgi:hypothetical protein
MRRILTALITRWHNVCGIDALPVSRVAFPMTGIDVSISLLLPTNKWYVFEPQRPERVGSNTNPGKHLR